MDLELAADEAYAHWATIWTDLQFRSGARARSGATVEPETSVVAVVNRSASASTSDLDQGGTKFGLQRPRTPSRGAGQAMPSKGVENDIDSGEVDDGDGEVVVELPTFDIDPVKGAKRAGKKITLQRPPAQPVQVDGHIGRKIL
jgi:hypothetical protein